MSLAPATGAPPPVYSVPSECPALIILFSPSSGHHGEETKAKWAEPRVLFPAVPGLGGTLAHVFARSFPVCITLRCWCLY